MNRKHLQQLTKLRVEEAKVLYKNGYFDGAYYLLGYAIECALKACIAKQTQQYDFPDKKLANDSHTHDLIKLLKLAGLKEELDNLDDNNIKANWSAIINVNLSSEGEEVVWSESIRYTYGITAQQIESFLSAITDQNKGILQWIEKYW